MGKLLVGERNADWNTKNVQHCWFRKRLHLTVFQLAAHWEQAEFLLWWLAHVSLCTKIYLVTGSWERESNLSCIADTIISYYDDYQRRSKNYAMVSLLYRTPAVLTGSWLSHQTYHSRWYDRTFCTYSVLSLVCAEVRNFSSQRGVSSNQGCSHLKLDTVNEHEASFCVGDTVVT